MIQCCFDIKESGRVRGRDEPCIRCNMRRVVSSTEFYISGVRYDAGEYEIRCLGAAPVGGMAW